MTRGSFFQGLLAMVMGQQVSGPVVKFSTGEVVCLSLDGKRQPCELKEDEERCPLWHVQKPQYASVITGIYGQWDAPLKKVDISERRASTCSVCGIVYVKQADAQ